MTGDLAERRRAGQAQAGIRRLEVIQRISNGDRYLSARTALMEGDTLHHGQVQVPGRQAAKVAGTATT